MITLYAFADAFGVNPSPFCQKVNIALDLSGLDYTIEVLADPRKAPKGKLPWLLDEGRSIADSEFIHEFAFTRGKICGEFNHSKPGKRIFIKILRE